MNQTRRDFLATTAAAISAAAFSAGPSRASSLTGPVTIVVGLSAGGATDLTARRLAARLEPLLGQRVLVENRPGAGSIIAGEHVAAAKPDGLTLFLGTGSFATNTAVSDKLSFDPTTDLLAITQLTRVPFCLAVRPDLGVDSVEKFVEMTKASSAPVPFASSGAGGQAHFAGELFKSKTGANLVHIPYKGAAPAITDVINGELSVIFSDIFSVLARTPNGELKILALTTQAPSEIAPDVPTLASLGIDGFDIAGWSILFTPKGTPQGIVDEVNAAVSEVTREKEFVEEMRKEGAELVGNSPAEAAAFFAREVETYRTLAKQAGLKM